MDIKRQAVYEYLTQGFTYRQLAIKYGVSRSTINTWLLVHQGIHDLSRSKRQNKYDLQQIKHTNCSSNSKTKTNIMKQFAFLLILATIISCHSTTETKPSANPVNVASLTEAFVAGWNNKDSAAIMKTIADNAIVMNDSLIHNGHLAIANNWISGGVKVISNIKISSTISDSDNKIAYDAGTYTLDLTPPGGPLLKEKGNYNLVWTKQQTGDWKLTLIHIEDITRMPDIK